MKLLLEDRFAPITSTVGFYEAPPQAVADALYQWQRSLNPALLMRVDRQPVRESFSEVLLHLPPLGGYSDRTLLLATDSPWTAYFDNGSRGPDPVSPVGHLCPILGCRGLIVMCIPDTLTGRGRDANGRYGAVQFQLLGPEETHFLNYVRTISATNDGYKWEFHANGAVQPFEKPEYYTARRIRDRFTPEMLEEYCAALGVRYFDPSFYLPEGVLVEVRNRLFVGERGKSLDQVQRELGIRD